MIVVGHVCDANLGKFIEESKTGRESGVWGVSTHQLPGTSDRSWTVVKVVFKET